jgi:cytochrome c oxidase assembly protein subunit 15
VLLAVNLYVAYQLYRLPSKRLHRLTTIVLGFLGLEILAGIVLAYLALPAAVQPVHLTVATLLFGGQFLILVAYQRMAKSVVQPTYPRVVA